ncbi:MAG TPA: hydrolase, carbon-nitrogen family protein [Eggerthellaceae bacterium]|nr:hydrolase, carbon-nitrogen family protein [Eggerthellaceae bacterium]
MAFILGLAQCAHPDDGDVVAQIGRFAREARMRGVHLLVFPEAIMTRYEGSPERFAAQAQAPDGPFAKAVDDIAAREGIWIAYTMNEVNPRGGHPFNTAVICDAEGRQRARYRKVHLFDAQGYRESDYLSAGARMMSPVQAPFARIGLGICYDLRFPEVALAAALEGAQIMLYPASWVDGPAKVVQWEALLAARAVENGFFVAGVGSCNERRIGHSCVFAPDGTQLIVCDGEEQLATCAIDLHELERVRAATPSLAHRRPDCYGHIYDEPRS